MAEADRLCDRIAIIDHGKIIALDTPRGLRRLLPAEAGIELVLEAGADPAPDFAGVGGVARVDTAEAGEGRWRVRLYGEGDGLADEALAASRRNGASLVELRRIEGSLEDVFVHLTGREMR
jgi:ABC-2 type transport system ATP-binding protein